MGKAEVMVRIVHLFQQKGIVKGWCRGTVVHSDSEERNCEKIVRENYWEIKVKEKKWKGEVKTRETKRRLVEKKKQRGRRDIVAREEYGRRWGRTNTKCWIFFGWVKITIRLMRWNDSNNKVGCIARITKSGKKKEENGRVIKKMGREMTTRRRVYKL